MIPGQAREIDGSEREVQLRLSAVTLGGTLGLPRHAEGIVLFAHGSGSSRHSPRNRYVAGHLASQGFATLLFDLLTNEEERIDARTLQLRFDIPLLTRRLIDATHWVSRDPVLCHLHVGYFGASTGAAAALAAAAELPEIIRAVVSRGGRPDLAGASLRKVLAPTLLIVGGNDPPVIEGNREGLAKLGCPEKQLWIVPGATHLFEEPGKLEEVARVAARWFERHLSPSPPDPSGRKVPRNRCPS